MSAIEHVTVNGDCSTRMRLAGGCRMPKSQLTMLLGLIFRMVGMRAVMTATSELISFLGTAWILEPNVSPMQRVRELVLWNRGIRMVAACLVSSTISSGMSAWHASESITKSDVDVTSTELATEHIAHLGRP